MASCWLFRPTTCGGSSLALARGVLWRNGFFSFPIAIILLFFVENWNMLQPFAVLPIQEAMTDLQSLADLSNGQVVFGFNDQGKQIPLGVILPENFSMNTPGVVKAEHYEECPENSAIDIPDDCVLPSVAAVEECVTECDNITNIEDIKSDVEKSPVIKIYKRSKPKRNSGKGLKLNDMKRRPNFYVKGKQIKITNVRRQKEKKLQKTKKVQLKLRRKKCSKDPTFPVPHCICQGNFQSKNNNFISLLYSINHI